MKARKTKLSTKRRAAYDSPWKSAVERLFPHFLTFFFAEIHALIDWKQPYKFLSQELAHISAGIEGELNKSARTYRKGERMPLRVDLLVEVYFNDGRKGRILLHLEIQNDRDPFFDERLFIYHYRIFDKTREPVITLALLTDFDPVWRPDQYVRELAGCRVTFNFPIRKLTDYNEPELAASRNPFAFIARAHLAARQTGDDMNRRYDLRLVLQDAVTDAGMDKQEVLSVTRFIEDVLRLPEGLDRKLFYEQQARKEKAMEYTTYAERIGERRGMTKGRKQGKIKGRLEEKQAGLLRLLQIRFDQVSQEISDSVSASVDPALLDKWFEIAARCKTLQEFEEQMSAG